MPLLATTVVLLSLAAQNGPSVQPPKVPAKGRQQALITVEKAGMYRLRAHSEVGTACQLIDHQRGPFASSGQIGRSSCQLDLLLDSGRYKLRLNSPAKGEGQVKIDLTPFTELNRQLSLLPEGRSVVRDLPEGKQLSHWIHLDAPAHVVLRVEGRSAGAVKLWRSGRWVEDISTHHEKFSPRPGEPLHSWRIEGQLEAGDYLLTAYGARPAQWTRGKAHDQVFVANGFAPAPEQRVVEFTLPKRGNLAWRVPMPRLVAHLELEKAGEGQTRLDLNGLTDKVGALESSSGGCRIEPKAQIPMCIGQGNRSGQHVLWVHGRPGLQGRLRWAPRGSEPLDDGEVTGGSSRVDFDVASSGRFWVAVKEMPADEDAPPLGCALSEKPKNRRGYTERAWDLLGIDGEHPLVREFNYQPGASIPFEIRESGLYSVATGGTTRGRCELYRLVDDDKERLSETSPDAKRCQVKEHLGKGRYLLRLHGGRSGVERLAIVRQGGVFSAVLDKLSLGDDPAKTPSIDETRTKASCRQGVQQLRSGSRYRMTLTRTGEVAARELVLRPWPLKLSRPLPLQLDGGESVMLQIAGGADIEVHAAGPGEFECRYQSGTRGRFKGGSCTLPGSRGGDVLVLRNPGTQGLSLSVQRPRPLPSLAQLQPHRPKLSPVPSLKVDSTRHLDFTRSQSHSMVLDVTKAGLYHVATTGLLSTSCRLRTPVETKLFDDAGGGRGRNCLIASYLKPGRYLLSVQTRGQSRGRAGVRVNRRPPDEGPSLSGESEVFFRVAENALLQQTITVGKSARYQLSTTGQGVRLQCRIDDAEGWPLMKVPARCDQRLELQPGTYLWTQLPLTVESMRRSALKKRRPALVLSGDKTHKIGLNTWYDAELGEDGQDAFRFTLGADLEVEFHLGNSMQGRLYRAGKRSEVLEVIPPADDGHSGYDEYDEDEYEEYRRPQRRNGGHRLRLTKGRYRLITQHRRGDVGISYRLRIRSEILAPGLRMEAKVPGELALRMPERGLARIKSRGDTDLRCRLFNQRGKLVAESADTGEDWNCSIVEPLPAGDYRLVLEAEGRKGGATRVSFFTPEEKKLERLAHGDQLKTGTRSLVAPLTAGGEDAVHELHVRSAEPFSCALEDRAGARLVLQHDTRHCQLLVRPGTAPLQVRLWSRRQGANLQVDRLLKPVKKLFGRSVSAGQAGRVEVKRSGHYRTARAAWCLNADKHGALKPCAPSASLAQGAHIFATTGGKNALKLSMDEIVARPKPGNERERVQLRRAQALQNQRSDGESLHLLSVRLPPGEASAPACGLAGGSSLQSDHACFAAARGEELLGRWWLAADQPRDADLVRRVLPLPGKTRKLSVGERNLNWPEGLGRFALPDRFFVLDLVLPANSWAVRLDRRGYAVELCPPEDSLQHCSLEGQAGELLVVTESRQLRARLLHPATPAPATWVKRLVERQPRAAGRWRLRVATAKTERVVRIEGATRCGSQRDDGLRQNGCVLRLPAGRSLRMRVDHPAAALRATVHALGRPSTGRWRWGVPTRAAEPLAAGSARALDAELTNAGLKLDNRARVRIVADAGVCALFTGRKLLALDGMGGGCRIDRVLERGNYRVVVRPFAGQTLDGQLIWSHEAVGALTEGVGPETWVAPGEPRFFVFETGSAGRVGLGLQVDSDRLVCHIRDRHHRLRGSGCQQFLQLPRGRYLLEVQAPAGGPAQRFKPVLVGLAGAERGVPDTYLKEFFQRIGVTR